MQVFVDYYLRLVKDYADLLPPEQPQLFTDNAVHGLRLLQDYRRGLNTSEPSRWSEAQRERAPA